MAYSPLNLGFSTFVGTYVTRCSGIIYDSSGCAHSAHLQGLARLICRKALALKLLLAAAEVPEASTTSLRATVGA